MPTTLNISSFLWSTVITLVVSHIGANYLKDVTPRGYVFWFTILNIIVGLATMSI